MSLIDVGLNKLEITLATQLYDAFGDRNGPEVTEDNYGHIKPVELKRICDETVLCTLISEGNDTTLNNIYRKLTLYLKDVKL